jgi:hypothetical protein
MPGLDDFDIRSNIPAVIADLAEVDKRLVRDLRRSIRESGERIIAEQREILASENPGTLTRRQYTRAQPTRRGGYRRGPLARQLGGARLKTVTGAASTGKSRRETRKRIADGLKTRLSVSKTRGASVRIVSTGASGDLPVKAFNRKVIRHRVFGTDTWAAQKGLQYFSRGIAAGASDARQRLEDVIREAQASIRRNPPIS